MRTSSLPPNYSTVPDAMLSPEERGTANMRMLAIQALEADPNFRGRVALGAIQIHTGGDTLVLKGRVPTYYLKQLLQETLRRVEGVAQVKNQVEVIDPTGLPPTP